jgi:hypothetical protein
MSRSAAIPTLLAHAIAVSGCGLMLYAVGQPIFTDDLWWHLGLGSAFIADGPWLEADPLLFDAAGPPRPASWLVDIALFEISRWGGFAALRLLHVGAVAAILAGVWRLLGRANRSSSVASAGVLAFVALAAYRLVQLRPELATIALTLALYAWILAPRLPLSARRIALLAAFAALWANLHAGFPLVLMFPAAALVGLVVAAPFRNPEARRADRTRAKRLAFALAAAFLGTLANPLGIHAHLAYLVAGDATPSLSHVSDEWIPVSLFALPASPQLPSPLSWTLTWVLLLLLASALVRAIRRARASGEGFESDPALLAVSLAAFAMMLTAVRFLWLGIVPLLWMASTWSAPSAGRKRLLPAFAAVSILAAFVAIGDWPAITRGLPTTWQSYSRPYPVGKYSAHAIWMLRDSGVRGNLYAEYFLGGFAGYWLAPEIRALVNGTLNVPRGTLDAVANISRRLGSGPDEHFEELIDRLDIDIFLGTRLPEVRPMARRFPSTTAHLEGVPGWIPIFRNPSSALYLRASDRNRENLERFARYYAARGVPFDPIRGFEPVAVIERANEWAVRHGVVPRDFALLAHSARHGNGAQGANARRRVATIYAALGLYDEAATLDRRSLAIQPGAIGVRRRLVWSLLRSGAFEEAAGLAVPLTARPASDRISHEIAAAAQEVGALEPESARARIAALPILTAEEARWLLMRSASPAPRPALGSRAGAQPPDAASESEAAAAAASS